MHNPTCSTVKKARNAQSHWLFPSTGKEKPPAASPAIEIGHIFYRLLLYDDFLSISLSIISFHFFVVVCLKLFLARRAHICQRCIATMLTPTAASCVVKRSTLTEWITGGKNGIYLHNMKGYKHRELNWDGCCGCEAYLSVYRFLSCFPKSL